MGYWHRDRVSYLSPIEGNAEARPPIDVYRGIGESFMACYARNYPPGYPIYTLYGPEMLSNLSESYRDFSIDFLWVLYSNKGELLLIIIFFMLYCYLFFGFG